MADIIIGREAECKTLEEIAHSSEAEFLAIYGRRRVGKTYLITNYFSTKSRVFFYVTGVQKAPLNDQIERFTQEMSRIFYPGLELKPAPNWLASFEKLTQAMKTQPATEQIVLFFDEIPWLAGPRSKFLSALDYYWNKHWSRMPNCKLIICGSSASWIIKKIINHKGGLHNRITRRIILRPFLLDEVEDYLAFRGIKLPRQHIVKLYMAMGGIPHYLKQIKGGLSADQNINEICFTENGILFDEFDKLFSSLFTNPKNHIEIIRLIAKTRQGSSRVEIENKAKRSQKGGGLSDRLEALEAAGFITSYIPVDHPQKGLYYRINDEYTYFYLTWIEPAKKNRLMLEANHHYWMRAAKSPAFAAWSGYSFEAVCYKHIGQIIRALRIDTVIRMGSWRYSANSSDAAGTQIDLLLDRDDEVITLVEIKYSDKAFVLTKAYQRNLLLKIKTYQTVSKTAKHITLALIAANGVKENAYSALFTQVVTLDNLFDS